MSTRARVLVGFVAVAVLATAGSGAAYGYFRAAGSGTATGGTTVSVTLSGGQVAGGLYPGGSTDVVTIASNPNAGPVRLGSLARDTSRGTSGYGISVSECPASNFTFTTQANAGNGWTVPANTAGVDGTLAITMPGALSLKASAPNACQGATVTVYLKAGA